MTRENLNIIISAAVSDNFVEDREEKIIRMLGKASGISDEEISEMLKKPKPIENLSAYSETECFETIYHLIQIMKADGKVFKSEIAFCKDIAMKLGYKRRVIDSLSPYIYSDPAVTADRGMLFDKANKFWEKR